MIHLFNRIFVYFSLTLLLASFVLVQGISRLSNQKDSSLGASKAAEAPMSNRPQVLGETDAGRQNLDLFFDSNFLQIQETLFDEKSMAVTFQDKIVLEPKIMPPQAVRVYDAKNGQVITVIWNKFDHPPAKIKIFRSESASGKASFLAETEGASLGYHDTEIEIGKRYYYILISENQNGDESPPAGPYNAGPIKDLTAPASPKNIKTVIEQGLVRIAWEDPADSDLRFINIYRSEKPGELGANVAQVVPGIGEFIDDAGDLKTYYYLLTSEDLAGNESYYDLIESETGRNNPFMPVF